MAATAPLQSHRRHARTLRSDDDRERSLQRTAHPPVPEQAATAHRDLRGKALVPVHRGMVNLANHDWHEPARRLQAAARAEGIRLLTPRLGEPVRPLDSTTRFEAWWEAFVGDP